MSSVSAFKQIMYSVTQVVRTMFWMKDFWFSIKSMKTIVLAPALTEIIMSSHCREQNIFLQIESFLTSSKIPWNICATYVKRKKLWVDKSFRCQIIQMFFTYKQLLTIFITFRLIIYSTNFPQFTCSVLPLMLHMGAQWLSYRKQVNVLF